MLREGKPVAKAEVICREEITRKLVTDEAGRFEFVVFPTSLGSRWKVWAVAEGGQWQSKPVLVTLEPGSKRSITLDLASAFEVRGVVKDAKTKQPVPFAEIRAWQELRTPEIWMDWIGTSQN